MFIQRHHRLLVGCRLLMWPAGREYLNWVGKEVVPTVTGTPVPSAVGVADAVNFDGSTYYQFAALSSYTAGTKDFTIFTRIKNTTVAVNGSGRVMAYARAGFPATSGFIFFLGNTPLATEPSLVGVVHANNTQIKVIDPAAASAYLDNDVPCLMTYEAASRTLTLYAAGEKKATTIDTSEDWDAWTSSDLYFGAVAGGGAPYIGDLGPVIIWDRCLGEDEAFDMMTMEALPFLRDESLTGKFPITVSYSTGLGVATASGLSGTVTYTTTLDSSAAFTGDLSSGGPAGTASYLTRVNVRSVGSGSEPTFARYVTRVTVAQAYSPFSATRYSTSVLLGQHKTVQIDSRIDLLDVFRYRR